MLGVLEPLSVANGGVLKVQDPTFTEGRPNIIVEYPCGVESAPTVSFVGCHMDVVPANPDEWDFNPFELGVEGDELRGRGVRLSCCWFFLWLDRVLM